MWGPNPPYIYFAGESLACARDTRNLALSHSLIWRSLHSHLYQLPQPGDRILLVFWQRGEGFVPLGRFQTRVFDSNRGEQPVADWGDCYCVVPANLRPHFLNATPGVGGHGYTAASNPDSIAICVEKVETEDAVELLWHGVAAGAHDLPLARYGWVNPPQLALQHFDSGSLRAPFLAHEMYP